MPKLLDKEQVAGNESDDLNPGQKGYDEQFPGKRLSDAEHNAVNDLDAMFDAPAIDDEDRNTHDPEENRADLADQEGQGNPDAIQKESDSMYKGTGDKGAQKTKTGRISNIRSALSKLKTNRGATGGLIALIFGGFGATSIIMAPITIMTNISTIVGNHTDLGDRLYGKTSGSLVASMLSGKDRNCEESKIKCKFGTISEGRKKLYEDRKIKVITGNSIIPGRVTVRGYEFPNGTKVQTLREYQNLRYTDSTSYSLLKKYPVRATYLNTKSAIGKSLGRVGTSLATKFKSSTKKEQADRRAENAQTMNSQTGAVVDEEGKVTVAGIEGKDKRTETVTKASKERLTGAKFAAAAASSVSVPVVVACMGYDIIRAAQAAMVLMWHEELIKFAVPFMQAGSHAKEAGVNGDFDWETAEYYGDRLTKPVTQNDIDADPEDTITQGMLGKTAMDSKGMAAALNGDPVMNNDYSSWSPVKDVMGSEIVTDIQRELGGAQNVRTACVAAQYGAWLSSFQCLAGPVVVVKCIGAIAATQFITRVWGDDIVRLVSDIVTKPAINAIAKANLSDSLTGPALGDAIVGGAGVLADYSDRAGGWPIAGTDAQALVAYQDTVNDHDFLESKLAESKEAAQKNQFDISNRYSFAGQISAQVASAPIDGSLFSVFKNLASTISSIPLGAKASAMKQGLYQPIEVYQSAEKFNAALKNCKSPGVNDLNIPCLGESGRTIPVILSPVKECLEEEYGTKNKRPSDRLCFEDAVDDLSSRMYKSGDTEKPFISLETGEPSDNNTYNKDKIDYDNPFLMYMRHCGNDRAYPIGYTDQPLDSKNYQWYDGSKCAATGKESDDTKLAWMSYYYNTCIALYASEEDQDYCWEDEPTVTPTASVGVVGGKWTYPTTCEPTKTSGFGPRWGTVHQGVDLAGPEGTAIFAANDGKVVQAGPASGFGNWIVLEHEIDGKKWGSVYGHMFNDGVLVKAGYTVKAGQQIGKIGNNGQSSGAHLHFEIWEGGRFGGAAVDPWPFIEGEKKCV